MAGPQTTTNVQMQSGNRIAVVMAGLQIGLIQSIDAEDDYAPDLASGIGDIHSVEAVPTRASHTLQVSVMVLKKGALMKAGIAAENGDAVLKGQVFEVEVYDQDSGALLRKWIKCSYARGTMTFTKHAIVMQNATLLALDASGVGI